MDFSLDGELDSMPELASIGHSSESGDESDSEESLDCDEWEAEDSGIEGDDEEEIEESMEADPSGLAKYIRNSIKEMYEHCYEVP